MSEPQLPQTPAPSPDPVVGDAARRTWWAEAAALGGTSALLDCPDGTAGGLDLTTAHPSGLAQLLAGRPAALSSLVRESGAFAEARRRARVVHRRADVVEDGLGLRGLALAAGLVGWNGSGGRRARRTPLLLRRCSLTPTSPVQDDFVLQLDPGVVVNPVLLSTVASELGVQLDAAALATSVVHRVGFDPDPALHRVREALRGTDGLRVERRLVVGVFADPARDLLEHLRHHGTEVRDAPLVKALAERRPARPGRGADTASRDEPPALPLDPEQLAVVQAVLDGQDVSVQAPAGTGATQVAAVLLAELVDRGRRPLLVADAPELDAVEERLRDAGLGALLMRVVPGLDPAATRTDLQGQDERARTRLRRSPTADVPTLPDVAGPADTLGEHARALHRPREPWGVSVYAALEALAALARSPEAPSTSRRLRGESLRTCLLADLPDWQQQLRRAVELGAFDVSPTTTPWAGARMSTAAAAEDVATRVRRAGDERLPAARARLATLSDAAGLRGPASVAEGERLVELLLGVSETIARFGPDIWSRSLGDVTAACGSPDWRRDNGIRLGWWSRYRLRREARALVVDPTTVESTEQLHRWLLEARALRLAWQKLDTRRDRDPHVPVGLAEARIALDDLVEDLQALEAVLPEHQLPERHRSEGPAGLQALQLPELAAQLRLLQADLAALDTLPERTRLLAALEAGGWQPLLDDLGARWAGPGSLNLDAEVEAAWWSGVLEACSLEDPLVGAVDTEAVRRTRHHLLLAEAAAHAVAAERLRARLDERIRSGGADPLPVLATAPAGYAALLTDREGGGPTGLVGTERDVLMVLGANRVATAALLPALANCAQLVAIGDPALPGPHPVATGGWPRTPGATPGTLLEAAAASTLPLRLQRQYACRDEALLAVDRPDDVLGAHDPAGIAGVPAAGRDGRRVRRTSARPIGTRRGRDALVDLVVESVVEAVRERPADSVGVLVPDAETEEFLADALRRRLPAHRPRTAAPGARSSGRAAVEATFVGDLSRWAGRRRDHVLVVADSLAENRGERPDRTDRGDRIGGARADQALRLALSRSRSRTTIVLDDSVTSGVETSTSPLRVALLRVAIAWETPVEPGAVAAGAGPAQADALLLQLADACRAAALDVTLFAGSGVRVPLAVGWRTPGAGGLAVEIDAPAWAALEVGDREIARPARWERSGWRYVRSSAYDVAADPVAEAARIAQVWREELAAVGLRPAPIPAQVPTPVEPEAPAEPGGTAGPEEDRVLDLRDPAPVDLTVTDAADATDTTDTTGSTNAMDPESEGSTR